MKRKMGEIWCFEILKDTLFYFNHPQLLNIPHTKIIKQFGGRSVRRIVEI